MNCIFPVSFHVLISLQKPQDGYQPLYGPLGLLHQRWRVWGARLCTPKSRPLPPCNTWSWRDEFRIPLYWKSLFTSEIKTLRPSPGEAIVGAGCAQLLTGKAQHGGAWQKGP